MASIELLEDAGIKLATVATDILDTSGRAMLDALVGGTMDPAGMAVLAVAGCVLSAPSFARPWQGSGIASEV
jgi:transposase